MSKRLGSIYRTSRTDQWLKMKNPEAPAAAAPAEACNCLSFSARPLPTAEHKEKPRTLRIAEPGLVLCNCCSALHGNCLSRLC